MAKTNKTTKPEETADKLPELPALPNIQEGVNDQDSIADNDPLDLDNIEDENEPDEVDTELEDEPAPPPPPPATTDDTNVGPHPKDRNPPAPAAAPLEDEPGGDGRVGPHPPDRNKGKQKHRSGQEIPLADFTNENVIWAERLANGHWEAQKFSRVTWQLMRDGVADTHKNNKQTRSGWTEIIEELPELQGLKH